MNSHIRSRPPSRLCRFGATSIVLACVALAAAACGGGYDNSSPTSPSVSVPFSQADLRVGTGAEATAGRRATVNYAGWLYASGAADNKGQQFDAGSFAFTVGNREVIAGFDQGVTGMRVGGIRRIVVPPALGYGAQGSPPRIPPNATLVFEVELTAIQ